MEIYSDIIVLSYEWYITFKQKEYIVAKKYYLFFLVKETYCYKKTMIHLSDWVIAFCLDGNN